MTPEEKYRVEHPTELRMYDIATDDFRTVTQGDVDQVFLALHNYSTAFQEIRKAMDESRVRTLAGRKPHE